MCRQAWIKPIAATLLTLFVLMTVTSPASAEYASLGITRHQVQKMLLEEGLNPTLNKYPDYEGEPVDELILFNPSISIQMFGPDSGLTGVELSIQRSDNENDAYWVGYITPFHSGHHLSRLGES